MSYMTRMNGKRVHYSTSTCTSIMQIYIFYGTLKLQCSQAPLDAIVGSTSNQLFILHPSSQFFLLSFGSLLSWSVVFFPFFMLCLLNWCHCIPSFVIGIVLLSFLWFYIWFHAVFLHISDLNRTSDPSALAAWQILLKLPANCSPWHSGKDIRTKQSLQFSSRISTPNIMLAGYNVVSRCLF